MNPSPSETYEGLLKQFKAALNLINSLESELSFYRKKDYSVSEQRLKTLESLLISEKEMNHILTEELLEKK